MAETKSYDDNKELPPMLVVSKFSAARGKEIQIMKNALSSSSGTKLAFQKLPRHMRRRAMSHNAKRLPRRLREIHINQMKKSGLLAQNQRSSRKYRRRPQNLMNDYLRRQKRCKWLDTHLWHAKRFHMIEKWGYKLPFRPCDKAFRACYRASTNHCLLQDISYYRCVEIVGLYDVIVDNFKKITDVRLGLTVGAKAFSKGNREGCVTVFTVNEKRAIGTVFFNWRPVVCGENRVLWLWIHVAYYNEVLDNLTSCFCLKTVSTEVDTSDEGTSHVSSEKIVINELDLSRFRLTGPLSNSVLQNAFRLLENAETLTKWREHYKEDINKQIEVQKQFWANKRDMFSTTEVSPNIVLCLTVEDPRLNRPKKRTKAVPSIGPSYISYDVPEGLAEGPIWDGGIRKLVKNEKPSNATLDEARRNLLVPGLDLGGKGTPVPIMLIQRPGKRSGPNIGYSSGWDLILPPGWAQPFWVSLVMWGARPGGLKQTETINFEMGNTSFLSPDTLAASKEESLTSKQCRDIYFRLPPNKRTNYAKFRIASPFEWNWKRLLSDWSGNQAPITDFFVLRDRLSLKNVQDFLTSTSQETSSFDFSTNCLVPVSIAFDRKGLCPKFSIICIPEGDDLKKAPAEGKTVDPNEAARKQLRKDHKILLKRLKRRRSRARKDKKVISIDLDVLKEYRKKMSKLWLPEAETIRNSCSREVIGFVKHGDFSLLSGRSKAVGFVALTSLPALLATKSKNKVLVRSTTSKKYHLGTLQVVME